MLLDITNYVMKYQSLIFVGFKENEKSWSVADVMCYKNKTSYGFE